MSAKKIKVLMVAAEVAPFAKAGGLGDVVGSLPGALKKLNCDVRVVMPLYGLIDRKKYNLKKIHSNVEMPSGGEIVKINIWSSVLPGTRVPVYFIDYPKYFGAKEVYFFGKDNAERFLFLSLACLYILPIIKFHPDVVHCHDSHTALIPDILKSSDYTFLQGIKTLFTIHNLNYQGKTKIETLSTGNLSKNSLKSLSQDAKDGDINFMAQGILGADLINTVSKTYAKEITTKEYGAKLDGLIKKRKRNLYGIVNGIDVKFFDPSRDNYIFKKYSLKTLDKKSENKIALQKSLGLPDDKNKPMLGMVTRLAGQKGLELITEKFADLDCQFVFVGSGHPVYEKQLKDLAKKYPEKFSAQIKFDVILAQQVYAASDIFLMPSQYEPCGLGQMMAMRYGTVPAVRATGGLADTVDSKVGFKFKKFTSDEFYKTLQKAIKVYHKKPKKWRKLQENCMKKDFSWNKSAGEYMKLYKKMIF